jgi:hypothetical protein
MMRLLAFPLSIFLATSLLAEDDLNKVPRESSDIEPPLLIQEIPSRRSFHESEREWEDGLTFRITEVTAAETPDANAEKHMTLKVGVKARPNTVIDPTKVKIQVFFYDRVDNKDVVLTNAHVSYAWVTPHHDWKGTKPEVLKVTFLRPQKKLSSKDAQRKDLGYIVRIYYNGQRQAVRAHPVELLNLFPPPLTLPSN